MEVTSDDQCLWSKTDGFWKSLGGEGLESEDTSNIRDSEPQVRISGQDDYLRTRSYLAYGRLGVLRNRETEHIVFKTCNVSR